MGKLTISVCALCLAVAATAAAFSVYTVYWHGNAQASSMAPSAIRDYVDWLSASGCGGAYPGCVIASARQLTDHLYVVKLGTSAGTCFNVAPGTEQGSLARFNHKGWTTLGVGYRC
jgi:hypothetical protein